MKTNWNKTLRWLTAIPLGITALLFLIFVPSAHVTMCMVCAVGYSVGLPMEKYEEKINKIVSFLAGGILFYTVYAGTTPLLIDWFQGFGWEVGVWIYHFVVNFALLVLFFTKKDRTRYILGGIEAFMIGSPVMFLIQGLFGREVEEGIGVVKLYVAIGLIILVIHQLLARFAGNFYIKLLPVIRKIIIGSLVVYVILQLIALPIILSSPNKGMRSGEERMMENNFGERGFENRRDDGTEFQRDEAKEIIFDRDGVEISFLWLEATGFMSNEESEIQVLNNSRSTVEIRNPMLKYITSGKTYDPPSEGWESYATPMSREYIDRVIIYDSVPDSSLILKPGQFGKFHYHFLFDDQWAQSANQTAQISLELLIGSKTHNVNKSLERTVKPMNRFESSAEHPVEEQINKFGPGPGFGTEH